MRSFKAPGALVAVLMGVLSSTVAIAGDQVTYDLEWTIQVTQVPDGVESAEVWIAVPQERPEQDVSDLDISTAYPWAMAEDDEFGNRVVRLTVTDPPSEFSIDLSAKVTRLAVAGAMPATLSETERRLYLREESLVSLSPRIRALADSISGSDRTRYEYVLASMDYDKTAPGWGRGDSERACDVGLGNCTDFHSLFMSLSRSREVPAVFEMGYSTVPEGETDRVGGYHCWAWFYDDDTSGWVPVDISEADKHPERAEFFFGQLDAYRILFSRGRSVHLPGMNGAPLNYLPCGAYVEVDGKPLDSVTRSLSYRVH